MYVCMYVCMYICMYASQGKPAVCQGVKMLSPSIFGMTGTDAKMDAYLTGRGSIDQQRAALIESPPPPAPPHQPTYLHLTPQQPVVTQRKHNNHQNSHQDELAPQRDYMGQGWEEIRKRRRPCCSGSTSRSLWAAGREEQRLSASGRLPSRNQQCGKVFTYNRAEALQQ